MEKVESLGMITRKQLHALTHRHIHKIKCIFLPDEYFIRFNISKRIIIVNFIIRTKKSNNILISVILLIQKKAEVREVATIQDKAR